MFIRVRSKVTGHQFDIAPRAFDAEKHELVKRLPAANAPRRAKYRVNYRTSAPKAVEGTALPISAGTEREGGEP